MATAQSNYSLRITPVDTTGEFITGVLKLQTGFASEDDCHIYINQLIPSLQSRGYITASIDSVAQDSAITRIWLYTGAQYRWASISAGDSSAQWLGKIGWTESEYRQQPYSPDKLSQLQHRMLNYLENNGYPFAKVYMEDMQVSGNEISGRVQVDPGPLYHIDTLKVSGNAKISNEYLQQFLNIRNGSVYSKEKLQRISAELKKLNYVEEQFPPRFSWGSTGGAVELFLRQKKSSQVNIIVGILPNSSSLPTPKLQVTGEGLLNLKNAFGAGETIGLIWQKLQAASQRLDIQYNQPYLFRSPFGIDFGFNMLKRDSAFLNFNIQLGAAIALGRQQSLKLYVERFSSILSYINETSIIATHRLPEEADVKMTHLGFEYKLNTTNYIFNPVSGFDISFNTSAGNKYIQPNHQILDLTDPADPDFRFASLYDTVKTKSYQVQSVLAAARYFPLGKARRSTLKTAINGGFISGGNLFRNELFQIGGYRLLRGFDEQSQFLSQYGIGTLEYRYLVGENSYFNLFTDGGWGKDGSRGSNASYSYVSIGAGLYFETKVGLFNLAWAVGKRNDSELNLRQSKIHFGFVNYF